MGILNTALIGKLKKIKANITDVLIKTNTVEYTPTEDYHPATKKYVDSLLALVTAKDDIVYTSLISSTNTVILSSTPVTKSIKYFVQAVNTVNDEVYTSEINVLNDNNDLYINEHSVVYSGDAPFMSFSVINIGTDATLTARANTADPIVVKFIRNVLEDFPEIALSEGYDDTIISLSTQYTTSFINYEIVVQNMANDELQKSNVIAIWDGTNVTYQEKNVIFTGSESLANFTFETDATYVKMVAQPKFTDQILYRVARAYLYTTPDLSTTTSASANQVVHQISSTLYRSVFYTVRVADSVNDDYQYMEFTVTHDGSNVYLSEHSRMHNTTEPLVEFNTIINSGNIELLASPSTSNELSYQIYKKVIDF